MKKPQKTKLDGQSETSAKPANKPANKKISKGQKTRQQLIEVAASLFQKQGFHATGIFDIAEAGNLPKGSIYYHFPGGKEEIGAAAVAFAGAQIAEALEEVAGKAKDPSDLMTKAAALLGDVLVESDFQGGCPVCLVALEVAGKVEPIRQSALEAYARWQAIIEKQLCLFGMEKKKAAAQAELAIAAIEGALILSQVQRSPAPLRRLARQLTLSLA